MDTKMLNIPLGVALGALVLVGGAREGAAQQGYFAGKTMELAVSRGGGGSQDRICRFLASHLERALAGGPKIVVKNRPGGTGVVATNWLYSQAPKDGTALGCFLPVRNYQAFFSGTAKQRGLLADMTKLVPVAGTPVVSVNYVRSDLGSGIKGPADLKGAPAFRTGGQSITNTKDITFRAVLDLAGIKYDYKTGYQDSSDAWAAVLRGEVQHHASGLPHFMRVVLPTGVKTGKVTPIYYDSGVVVPGLEPAVPVADFIRMHGGKPEGKLWSLYQTSRAWRVIYLPPGVPEPVVAELEAAFAKMFGGKAFIDAHKERYKVHPAWVAGRKALDEQLVAAYRDLGPSLVTFRKAYIDKARR